MAQLQLQLTQQQQQFLQANNFQGKQNAQNAIQQTLLAIAQAERNLYRLKDVDVRLRAAENLQVRWATPPPDYDDKGNLKKYTKDELKALRGTEGLPGYKGDKESLQKGQLVRVYLKASAAANKYAPKTTTKGKKKGPTPAPITPPDDVTGVQDRPEVLVIEILAEAKQ